MITSATCAYANNNLFSDSGIPSQELLHLLEITGIEVPIEKNIFTINTALQSNGWHVKSGVERWELKLPAHLASYADSIITICHNELAMSQAIFPCSNNYAGILFLGATLARVIDRTNFYNELVLNNRIDSKLKIWVLTGERKLSHDAKETEEALQALIPINQQAISLPTTELEMIQYVYHYLLPEHLDIEYIYSDKDPIHTRATTASTVIAFIDKVDKTSSTIHYLAISNQPHIDYQESVINLILKQNHREDIQVEVVGNAVADTISDKDNYAAILLNTIAKTVSNLAETYNE